MAPAAMRIFQRSSGAYVFDCSRKSPRVRGRDRSARKCPSYLNSPTESRRGPSDCQMFRRASPSREISPAVTARTERQGHDSPFRFVSRKNVGESQSPANDITAPSLPALVSRRPVERAAGTSDGFAIERRERILKAVVPLRDHTRHVVPTRASLLDLDVRVFRTPQSPEWIQPRPDTARDVRG
ncbi:hypothetical protein SKAU_G00351590 [Synaphobranchus kaupii]|uniref:Uncharacterized protein n=1 Tax=Synaphobranchus kaupii TaxID=118154 RepID=A0A9Q1EKG7_SYNKA|nr:hypothetical protein SKAU_G00351590 [Synaphobranchus kaupii]